MHTHSVRSLDTPIAVIDIGSNSIHLLVALVDAQGHFTVLDSDKAHLRLGEALDSKRNLSPKAIEAAVQAIRHMKKIAASYKPVYRAVATHVVRTAKNYNELFKQIDASCHLPVSLIDGEEEARLVAVGMQAGLALRDKTFLGVDIGGGSTELIVCHNEQVPYVTSVELGAVVLQHRFLTEAGDRKKALARMHQHIALKLAPLAGALEGHEVSCAVVCAGAAKSLAAMHGKRCLDKLGETHGYNLPSSALEGFYNELQGFASTEALQKAWGLETPRAKIMVAGTAILKDLSQFFQIPSWVVSGYGLREGLVLDTYSRLHGPELHSVEDVRWRNILTLASRYQVDKAQAERVMHSALELYDGLQALEGLGVDEEPQGTVFLADRGVLKAAAWLHEAGKFINYSRYHKHSFYLIAHSRLLGFSQKERRFIALVARFQRKGRARRKQHECLDLSKVELRHLNCLAAMLRCAAVLNRSRGAQGKLSLTVERQGRGLGLVLSGPLEAHAAVNSEKLRLALDYLEESLGLRLGLRWQA